MSTAKVHLKCKFYSVTSGQCALTHAKRQPWDDGCNCYEVKDKFEFKVK